MVAVLVGGLAYLILIVLVAWACDERGRNALGFVAIAIFLTPLFALLLLAAAGDKKERPVQET